MSFKGQSDNLESQRSYQAHHQPIAESHYSTPGLSTSIQEGSVYQHTFAEQPNTSQVHVSEHSIILPVHYVQMLEQELDDAKQKLQEYETTIAHQANLLCQNSLARDHTEGVLHASSQHWFASGAGILPSISSCHTPGLDSLQPRIATLSGTSQAHLISIPDPPIAAHTTSGLASLDSGIIKRQRQCTDEEPASKKARHSHNTLTSASSQLDSVIIIPGSPSSHSTSTDFNDASTASQSNEPDWSVEYNTKVDRTLEVNLKRTIKNKRGAYHIKFSPDGQLLAVLASENEIVTIYGVSTGARICQLEDLYVKDRSSFTHDLNFSPDGKYLATCTGWPENIIRIWEVGKKRVRRAFKGHLDNILCLDFSPNGRFLITGSQDGTGRIWNMRDGSSRIFDSSSVGITSVRFSPNGGHIAAGTSDCDVLLWETRSGHLVASLKGHTRTVSTIFFMPNGEGLISGSWDGTLKYRDVSGSTSARISDGKGAADDEGPKESLTFVGHTRATISVSVSPDGQWFAFDSVDRTIRIWNTFTGAQHCILRAHEEEVFSVHFSPAGGYLASADCGGTVRIWRYEQV